jgi:hypothetical protein
MNDALFRKVTLLQIINGCDIDNHSSNQLDLDFFIDSLELDLNFLGK